jgi:hypothetical protein
MYNLEHVAAIHEFVHDSAQQYMVLHGKGGSGKSYHLNEALRTLKIGKGEPVPTIVVWNQDESPYSIVPTPVFVSWNQEDFPIVGHKSGMLKFILVRREMDIVARGFIEEQQAVVVKFIAE